MLKMPRKIKSTASLVMLPPWMKYPTIPAKSIAWRIGTDPDKYLTKFREWWSSLDAVQRKTYREIYPAPQSWRELCQKYGHDFFYDEKEEVCFSAEKNDTKLADFWETRNHLHTAEDIERFVNGYIVNEPLLGGSRDPFWARTEAIILRFLLYFDYTNNKCSGVHFSHIETLIECEIIHPQRCPEQGIKPFNGQFEKFKAAYPDYSEIIKEYEMYSDVNELIVGTLQKTLAAYQYAAKIAEAKRSQ